MCGLREGEREKEIVKAGTSPKRIFITLTEHIGIKFALFKLYFFCIYV